MSNLDMRHAPTCQQLVIVRTEGYSHTINRCDECGAITTTRHGAPEPVDLGYHTSYNPLSKVETQR